MLTDPKVSACMVLFHAGEDALRAARCVRESTVPVTLFAVDNSPAEKTAAELIRQYPDMTVLGMKRNLGYGTANNAVIPYLKTRYHVIMNTDVTFAPDLIERMMDFMEKNPEIVILSPKVLNTDGTEQFLPRRQPTVRYLLGGVRARRGAKVRAQAETMKEAAEKAEAEAVEAWKQNKEHKGLASLLHANRLEARQAILRRRAAHRMARANHLCAWRDEYTLADILPQEPTEVQFATGCFMMIRTHVFYRMEGFDPRFFLYHEDSDLSRRAMNFGKIVYHPEMEVVHAWHRDSSHEARAALRHLRSTLQYFHKWGWRW